MPAGAASKPSSKSNPKSTPTSRSFRAALVRDGAMCFIPVPCDPRAVFGQVRAPVQVALNGYTYRSAIPSSRRTGRCLGAIASRQAGRPPAGLLIA